MSNAEKPRNAEDLLAQATPMAGEQEKIEEKTGESEKVCPLCKGAKSAGTPTECQMCGGTGLYSVYAIKNL